jgi:hypothetical protein
VSRPAPVFQAVVDADLGLHFEPMEREQRRAHLATFRGARVSVEIKPWRSVRSRQANAYYWSCVLAVMAKDQEMTPEEIHDAMCARFLPNEAQRVAFFNKLTGEELAVYTDGRRSSKLTGDAFYDFVERVRLFALEFLGVVTADPDPLYWRKRSTTRTEGRNGMADPDRDSGGRRLARPAHAVVGVDAGAGR